MAFTLHKKVGCAQRNPIVEVSETLRVLRLQMSGGTILTAHLFGFRDNASIQTRADPFSFLSFLPNLCTNFSPETSLSEAISDYFQSFSSTFPRLLSMDPLAIHVELSESWEDLVLFEYQEEKVSTVAPATIENLLMAARRGSS